MILIAAIEGKKVFFKVLVSVVERLRQDLDGAFP